MRKHECKMNAKKLREYKPTMMKVVKASPKIYRNKECLEPNADHYCVKISRVMHPSYSKRRDWIEWSFTRNLINYNHVKGKSKGPHCEIKNIESSQKIIQSWLTQPQPHNNITFLTHCLLNYLTVTSFMIEDYGSLYLFLTA